ncbi:hypothetical protein ANT_07330 [Anaerolinea thermophila UNI-1]|uniref:Uncharacterized protein n=1 Tax=Anaerolinea thermophila (strain DSM 14523 / JCM 11388 / NBRC 100420 / UNI-1) TaxID=926569 RepID=E8N2G1_ANATU|nr:hypothetical protein ANT_07330 [Anaerolinea thermophila UNI-1]
MINFIFSGYLLQFLQIFEMTVLGSLSPASVERGAKKQVTSWENFTTWSCSYPVIGNVMWLSMLMWVFPGPITTRDK